MDPAPWVRSGGPVGQPPKAGAFGRFPGSRGQPLGALWLLSVATESDPPPGRRNAVEPSITAKPQDGNPEMGRPKGHYLQKGSMFSIRSRTQWLPNKRRSKGRYCLPPIAASDSRHNPSPGTTLRRGAPGRVRGRVGGLLDRIALGIIGPGK